MLKLVSEVNKQLYFEQVVNALSTALSVPNKADISIRESDGYCTVSFYFYEKNFFVKKYVRTVFAIVNPKGSVRFILGNQRSVRFCDTTPLRFAQYYVAYAVEHCVANELPYARLAEELYYPSKFSASSISLRQ